ncbi:MAG: DUF4157 domain-containing protein [Spirulina sp. SIO3F2]|nr:DUF4157 domain-containing protein [Spirulina sp. SIO3F2]
MGRQYQTRIAASSANPKRKSQFMAPPVVQPKLRRQKTSELPDGSRTVDPLARLKETAQLQAKLSIGQPNDKYEQEADRVARDVVQRLHTPIINAAEPGPTINLKSYVQRSSALTGGEASSELESSINRAKGGGQALDAGLQQSMGNAMGADFSNVQVHTDSTSDQLNQSIQARAFTTGSDVFFKKGEYNPGSKGGQELIAHELTHVVQQTGNTVQRSGDEVIQRWLADSNGNVMNPKAAVQFLVAKKIPKFSAELLVEEAKKDKSMIRPHELIPIARKAMQEGWKPIQYGHNLQKYIKNNQQNPDQPWTEMDAEDDVAITEAYVRHEDIRQYITQKEQDKILKYIQHTHNSGAVTPMYWVRDPVSKHGNFTAITHARTGLRPVIGPESFAKPSSGVDTVYRGGSLSPTKLHEYKGFRAWGADLDIYYHTFSAQTARGHSAWVSTSDDLEVAKGFAQDVTGDRAYIYKISTAGLNPIKVYPLSAHGSDEQEVVIPYHVPLKNIKAVKSVYLGNNKWYPLTGKADDAVKTEQQIKVVENNFQKKSKKLENKEAKKEERITYNEKKLMDWLQKDPKGMTVFKKLKGEPSLKGGLASKITSYIIGIGKNSDLAKLSLKVSDTQEKSCGVSADDRQEMKHLLIEWWAYYHTKNPGN